ncbi:MAG: ABC transporter substrate-binding protein [Actinomyces sp.]|nr:MAG: ABC transporter substrate-binding protein [Actinomyces sp.]
MEIKTGAGVDAENKVIRVGLNADLSGIFAALTTKIVDGQLAFWEAVNDNGGLGDGWTVEPVVLDNAYDVPTHKQNYEIFSGDGEQSVVMLTNSTGSPHTAAIAQDLIEDDMAAIPLSWYSGWADPEIGKNVFEVQTNYCIEAMNAVSYLIETYGPKGAVAGLPGDYGEDGAIGAKYAIEQLGGELVYDGQAAVVPGADQTPVITGIAESGADWVWLTTSPGTTAEIIGGVEQAGFDGVWSGNSPSMNHALLDTALGPVLDAKYIQSTYTTLWGVGGEPGMSEMIDTMRQYRPDAPLDDVYIISWVEGLIAQQALEKALENGDITRAGVLAAMNEIQVDYHGLAPNQTWSGDPNDYVVRESYLYDMDSSVRTPGATVSDEGGTGFTLIQGPFVSDVAANWTYEPCFKPA